MKKCVSCGDIDITPCAPTIPADPIPFKKCNPCKKTVCLQKVDASCTYYKLNQHNCGEGLKYLNIQNNTSLENVIEEIDDTFNTITKPTLINCFATKSGINPNSDYRLDDVLLKLQEGYCLQNDLTVSGLTQMLNAIKDNPSLKDLLCEIISTC